MSQEQLLDQSAKWYNSSDGFKKDWGDFHKHLMRYRFKTIENWLRGESCIEFGTADGESTKFLFNYFKNVVAVEGAEHFYKQVRKRFSEYLDSRRFEVHWSMFEDFQPDDRYNVVLALHVLEHLAEPVAFLKRVKNFLKENGVLIVMVPNAQSIHRLVAVKMGLLEAPHSLNPQDIQLGHTRVYYPQELFNDIYRSGLQIIEQGGILFKPLTNKQLQNFCDIQIIDGFYELGKDFAEYAAEIYAVCQLPRSQS